jgi:hypothetical protein
MYEIVRDLGEVLYLLEELLPEGRVYMDVFCVIVVSPDVVSACTEREGSYPEI